MDTSYSRFKPGIYLRAQWVWVDIYNPTKEESEIISALLGNEPEVVEKIKERTLNPLNIKVKGCVLCDYEKVNDYVLVTIPSISMKEQLQMYPIVLAKKKILFRQRKRWE